jgi:2-oxoglutarate dehydrogenase E1 component
MRPLRKPLVIMTPKSLLRHPLAVSALSDFEGGGFERIIADPSASKSSATQRVLFCSGKIYYDLLEARERYGFKAEQVLIHRVEQLYPLNEADMVALCEGLPEGAELLWVQEEPLNQGAWPHMRLTFGSYLETSSGPIKLQVAARPASASPATGSSASHKIEQERLMREAFAQDLEA